MYSRLSAYGLSFACGVLLVVACNTSIADDPVLNLTATPPAVSSDFEFDQAVDRIVQSVPFSGEAKGAPPGCSAREMVRLIVSFYEAFNRAHQERLAQFFSEEFEAYSVSESIIGDNARQDFRTSRRSELLAYFARRHSQHERISIRKLKINGWEQLRNYVHVEFTLARRADDLRSSTTNGIELIAEGKGAIICTQDRKAIDAWGVGDLSEVLRRESVNDHDGSRG